MNDLFYFFQCLNLSTFQEQAQEQVGEDKQSTGRSELDKSDKGHRGEKQAASHAQRFTEKQKRHENKPGKTDHERTLGKNFHISTDSLHVLKRICRNKNIFGDMTLKQTLLTEKIYLR